jgi:pilus assembly protein CpaB
MSNLVKFGLLFVGALLVALMVRVVVVSLSQPAHPVVATEKVRVSAANLPQGLLLRDEDLTWKSVPVADVPSGAVVADTPGAVELKGALLRHATASGTVLVADDVILPGASGFLAATLKPDMRAVSVAVDDVSGNAGLIQPGDYVDLLLTQQMDRRTDSPELAVSSETVVEHARVLAVGSEISRPKRLDIGESNNPARTVTLEVTPRMGEVVAVAARLGSLSLALRSFATDIRDTASAPDAASQPMTAPVWAGDISRAVRELAKPAVVQVPGQSTAQPLVPRTNVIIYRGSDTSDTMSSNLAPANAGVAGGAGSAGVAPPLPSLSSLTSLSSLPGMR